MESFFTEYHSVSESFLGTKKNNLFESVHPMVIMNLTPDSFSDGGELNSAADVELKFSAHKDSENTIFDFGAESTAPKSQAISCDDELKRFRELFYPFAEKLGNEFKGTFSIDTYKGDVFKEVYQYLKDVCPAVKIIWNDVSGVLDEECIDVLKSCNDAEYVFCHTTTRDRKLSNQHLNEVLDERPENTARELMNYFKGSELTLAKHDISDRTYFDPCFGFSKNKDQNLRLIRDFSWLVKKFQSDRKWVVGISKKSFLRDLSADTESIHVAILTQWLRDLGDRKILFRVHDPNVVKSAKAASNILF